MTENQSIQPIEIDFKNIRQNRQKHNNLLVLNSIRQTDKISFYKHINEKELDRTLDEIGITFDEFWDKCCQDDLFAKLACGKISKCSSRQGTKDEEEQLNICNNIAEQCGIKITNLTTTALRPTKDGNIVSKKEMKQQKISKDCCLKSFDGKISGSMNGYIAAKVLYGSGGHQDNVIEEMDTLANWWSIHKVSKDDEVLVLLLDTDLKEKASTLKKKYQEIKNIKVFNHYEFQNFMISTYYQPINNSQHGNAN